MAVDTGISDQDLVERVRAGSEPAFEVLFDRHHRSVLAFCRRMLRSRAEAEDAAQSTFIAAYYDLMRSERPIVLRPWLYAIARHRCLNVLRDGRRERDHAAPATTTDRRAPDVVVVREDLCAVLADISGLPEDQRTALVLAELGDHSHEEIAQAIGCRREKVKALVFQARASLIADRAARDTACTEVRAQLRSLRGTALRRAVVRRHLRGCPGCRAFREDLRGERRSLLLLPLTAVAGLRRLIMGAVIGPGTAAEGTAIAGAVLNAGALAATAVVAVTIAGGGGGVHAPSPAPAKRAPAGAPRGIQPHRIDLARGPSAGHAARAPANGERHRPRPTAHPHGSGPRRPPTSAGARAPGPTGAAAEPSASAPQNAPEHAAPSGPAATSAPDSKGPPPTPAREDERTSPPKQAHPVAPNAPPARAKAEHPAGRPATLAPTPAPDHPTPADHPARPTTAGPAQPGSAAAAGTAAPARVPDPSLPAQAVGAERGRPTS